LEGQKPKKGAEEKKEEQHTKRQRERDEEK
jgi:hypothetical protein